MEQATLVTTSTIRIWTLWRQCLLEWFRVNIQYDHPPWPHPVVPDNVIGVDCNIFNSHSAHWGYPRPSASIMSPVDLHPLMLQPLMQAMPIQPLFWRFPFLPCWHPFMLWLAFIMSLSNLLSSQAWCLLKVEGDFPWHQWCTSFMTPVIFPWSCLPHMVTHRVCCRLALLHQPFLPSHLSL